MDSLVEKCSKCRGPVYTSFKTCSKCRDKSQKNSSKYVKTVKGRAQKLWKDARYRAKLNNLEFTLSLDKVIKALERGYCEKLGPDAPFSFKYDLDKVTYHDPWAPSLDRIDPAEGYTDENTQIVCWIHNCSKGRWTNLDHKWYIQLAAKAYNIIGEII